MEFIETIKGFFKNDPCKEECSGKYTKEDLKNIKGPKLLHIITKKGKGLPVAESNPTTYHAPGVFNPLTGEIPESKSNDEILKFQDVFGETLVELAKENEKIVRKKSSK